MASIRIEDETESTRGWRYTVHADPHPAFEVRLSFSDYDHFSRGALPPARIVEALVRVLIERDALKTLGTSFDASTARRLVRTLDRDLDNTLAEM